MEAPQRPVVILCGSLTLAARQLTPGVVLVHQGHIVAAGAPATTPIPAEAALLDALHSHVSAGHGDNAGQPVRPGQIANLVSRSPHGPIQWMMCAGQLCYPQRAPSPPAAITWQQHRQAAIDTLYSWLHRRPQTIQLRQAGNSRAMQRRGIDILWQIQRDAGTAQTLTLRVIPTLMPAPNSVFVLDGRSAQQLPEASLSHTQARWWLYHHGPDNKCYALPTQAFRRWLQSHARYIKPQPVHLPGRAQPLRGRRISIATLQQALPKTRIINIKSKRVQ